MAIKGRLTNIQRYSIQDGPGIRTTAFLKGCPLHCAWCHNPECIGFDNDLYYWAAKCIGCGKCIDACPRGAQLVPKPGGTGKIDRTKCVKCMKCVQVCRQEALTAVGFELTAEELADRLFRDHIFYKTSGGGVTISGGEPLAQPAFTKEVLRLCKEKELHTCIDTTLYAPWSAVQDVAPFVDLALVDLKHMDSDEHKRLTGVPNERIHENLRKLSELIHIRIRIPMIPGFNATEANLKKTAEFVAPLNNIDSVDLLPFHNWADQKYRKLDKDYVYGETPDMTKEYAETFRHLFEELGLHTTIGG